MLQSKVNCSCSLTSGTQGYEHLHQESVSSDPGNVSGPVPGSWEWFYIFRWLEKNHEESNSVTSESDTKFKFQHPEIVLLSTALLTVYTRPQHLYHHSRAEKLWQVAETVWPHGTFTIWPFAERMCWPLGLEWGDVTAQGHHEGSDTCLPYFP